MDELNYDELRGDLAGICEKHGLSGAAFCGSRGGRFIGLAVKQRFSPTEFFLVVTNIGRLWQWAREETKQFLDRFERKW